MAGFLMATTGFILLLLLGCQWWIEVIFEAMSRGTYKPSHGLGVVVTMLSGLLLLIFGTAIWSQEWVW